jgi:hypothetical protein
MKYSDIDAMVRREIEDEKGADTARRVKAWQMLAYANEAEAEACIRARLLTDSTTNDICAIAIEAGKSVYAYDPRIVYILRGRISGQKRPMVKVSHTVMDELYPGWDERTGEVQAFVTGLHKGMLQIYRQPTAPGVLNLTVVRTPLTRMAANGDTPEIPERFHPGLVLWIKHRVYNNQDTELFDKNRADVHLAEFERMFGVRQQAFDLFDLMPFSHRLPERQQYGHDYGSTCY